MPNFLATDNCIAGVIEKVDVGLLKLLREARIKPKPILICSGGTSSRCTAPGHWTLDLRNEYQNIEFDLTSKQVEFEAGITMGKLLEILSKEGRTFPIGLSNLTGLGYILTGGVSPLSRSQGLAIDQIETITGVWGRGEPFEISRPDKFSNSEIKMQWRGLCGAAPFLAIVTSLKVVTSPLEPLLVWQKVLNPDQLSELIQIAENWPNSISLQWAWGDKINAYVVIKNANKEEKKTFKRSIKDLTSYSTNDLLEIPSLHNKPDFIIPLLNKAKMSRYHSEVLSLLGPIWSNQSNDVIKSLNKVMTKRPDTNCYIASQQLGGSTCQISPEKTSFVHRQAIWKPWITAAWPAGDNKKREKSLSWLREVWRTLEPYCPGVHMSQMHPHLSWHEKELNDAFKEWLPGLKSLKSRYDPQGLLPPL